MASKSKKPASVKPHTLLRKDILQAQAGALATQLGTLDFNVEAQKQQLRAQIAEIMREVQAIERAEPKAVGGTGDTITRGK